MMSLSKFSGGGGTPLRSTWLTTASGSTFTPLADTTWFHIIMCGAGGAGGASSTGYGGSWYSAGGKGGTAATTSIFWYKRESVSGTPIATYSFLVGSYSGFNTAWNTGSLGTLGTINANGGSPGSAGLGPYQGSVLNYHAATAGESSLLGSGGGPYSGYGQGYGAGGGGGAPGYSPAGDWGSLSGGGGSYGVIIVTEY